MAFELDLSQRITQTLKISAQLQQAIKLLTLTSAELQQEIEQFCLTNPLLEFRKDSPEETEIKELEEEPLSGKSFSGIESIATGNDPDNWVSSQRDLVEDLAEQISFSTLSVSQKIILYNLIGNLDRRGYLLIESRQLGEMLGYSTDDVEEMLDLLKSLEPAGIGARNLAECLQIQLERRGWQDTLCGKIVSGYLTELSEKKYKIIAQALNCSIEQINEAVIKLQTLNPEPLSGFNLETDRLVEPELILIEDNHGWKIILSDDVMQKLSYSPVYMELISNNRFNSKADRSYFNKKYKEASWLIRSIIQRNSTLLKVAECIFRHQSDFIKFGPTAIRPMILADVAREIDVHESTVSRAVNEKYIVTPRGILPLKFFFGSKVSQTQSGIAIKEKIRQMISSEDSQHPLSDQKICETLAGENIMLARRTVAKYRDELKIPSARDRKV